MKRLRKTRNRNNEEQHEPLTIEQIKERLRTGYTFYPTQPGLKEAARELIRPLVEGMKDREIVYVCRGAKLMRVDELRVNDDGFRAVATPLNGLGDRIPTMTEAVILHRAFKDRQPTREEWRAALNALPTDTKPLDFGAPWAWLRLHGSAICMNMLTDCFYPDPALVAEVKAAANRGDYAEVSAILARGENRA